jgi:hypothetical protein
MKARYVKVILFEPVTTNLQGGIIVGQWGEYLLVERPQPKQREKVARKPRAKKVPTTGEVAEG